MSSLFWRFLILILTSNAVVGVVVGLIFSNKRFNLTKAKTWIEANTESWNVLKNLAYDTVVAAQQMFDANDEKKAYVLKFLASHSSMSEDEINVAIEGAIKLAKKEFGDQWGKLPVTSVAGLVPSS